MAEAHQRGRASTYRFEILTNTRPHRIGRCALSVQGGKRCEGRDW